MDRFTALDKAKEAWLNTKLPLGERVTEISEAFYGFGLDLVGTATYIGATPAELSILLTMAGKSDEVLDALSRTNPPITACAVLAEATDEDILKALDVYTAESRRLSGQMSGEFMYNSIIEVVGPTVKMKVAALTGRDLQAAREKAIAYGKLPAESWGGKFLKSVAGARKSGKTLTDKQVNKLEEILRTLCNEQVFIRNSMDGDQDLCDAILDALDL